MNHSFRKILKNIRRPEEKTEGRPLADDDEPLPPLAKV
jgi:hypothetical protein